MRILKILSLLFPIALAASGQSRIVDKVIMIVGDEPILLSDVEESRISYEKRGIIIDNPYSAIPEQIAIQKLFIHQALLDSVEVNDSEISADVNERINTYIEEFGSRQNVEMYAGKSISQLREDLTKRLREENLVQGAQRNLTKGIKVTPAEVREFFRDIPQDSLPMIPTQVELQILTQEPQPTPEEVERVQEQLRDIARRVNAGETSFSAQARAYSQDGSAKNGGELGFTGRGKWVPEFSKVAFSMNEPNKVSRVVKTEFGFHIIQFLERRGDRVNVRHILLKPQIENSEYNRLLLRLDSIGNDIRDGKFTFDAAALALSDDEDTRNNNGLMVNKKQHNILTSRFKMSELPAELARVVDTLKVGEVSNSFMMDNGKGKTVCAIVCLKNRIPEHRANMTEDFQELKDVVFAHRCDEKIDEWIREKQKTTYIKIDPEWKHRDFKYPGWVKDN